MNKNREATSEGLSQPAARVLHPSAISPTALLLASLLLIGVLRLATLGTLALTDNTEARYAGISWQMFRSGDWVTPRVYLSGKLVPFWAKPPLFFWVTSLSFEACGASEWGARLPNFLISLAVVGMTVAMGRRFWGPRVGALAGLILASSGLFFVLSGSCILDMSLAASVCLALVSFAQFAAADCKGAWWGRLFFFALALGGLAKGPVALVLVGLAAGAWIAATGQWALLRRLPWLSGGLILTVVAGPWYVLAERATPGFLHYFLLNEHILRYIRDEYGDLYGAGRTQPYGASWLMLLVTFLPWSPLVVQYAFNRWRDRRRQRKSVARAEASPEPGGRGSARLSSPKSGRAASEEETLSRSFALPQVPRLSGFRSAVLSADRWLVFVLIWGLTPALFFTFCRQILVTYLLPGFPGLALAAAVLVDRWLESADSSVLLKGLRGVCVGLGIVVIGGLTAECVLAVPPWAIACTLLAAGAFAAIAWNGHNRAEAPVLLAAMGQGTALVICIGIVSAAGWVEEAFSTKTILTAIARLPQYEECTVCLPFGDEYSADFYQEACLGRRLERDSHKGLNLLVGNERAPAQAVFIFRRKDWQDLERTIRATLSPIAESQHWVACRRNLAPRVASAQK